MSSLIPSGFEDLCKASERINGEINIMGRVTDHLSPTPSRGFDLMSTFSITDASYDAHSEGLKIRFFKPSEGEHPQIRSTGDVVLLRKIKIKEWKNIAMGLSSTATSWIVFPAAEIPVKAPQNRLMIKHIKLPKTDEPSHSEMLYAIELCNLRDRKMDISSGIPISSTETLSTWTAPSTGGSTDAPASSSKPSGRLSYSGRDKFSLIKDLHISSFYDIVGQVVKIFPNHGRLELYITDYTANNMLYRHMWGEEDNDNSNEYDYNYGTSTTSKSKKWPGPYGQMTLMVTLWPPHSYFAQSKVSDWNFVLLQNVHIKQDQDCKMEGALHEDRFWPNKVQISVLSDHSDERVKNVLRRKLEYNAKFNAQSSSFVSEARRQKQNEGQGEKSRSKGAARRKRKLEKERQAAAASEEVPSKKQKKKQNPHKTRIPSDSPRPLAKPTPKLPHTDLNKNVHCSHHTIPTTPLASILSLESTHQTTTPSGVTHTLPFQNLKTRTTVRVVDFFPRDIADFAVRSRQRSEFDALSDYEGSESDSESGESDSGNDDTDDENGEREHRIKRGKEAGNGDGERGQRASEDAEESDEEQQWEWRFALILEDAESPPPAKKGEEKARITAYVAQQEGDFLLKEDAVKYVFLFSFFPLPSLSEPYPLFSPIYQKEIPIPIPPAPS